MTDAVEKLSEMIKTRQIEATICELVGPWTTVTASLPGSSVRYFGEGSNLDIAARRLLSEARILTGSSDAPVPKEVPKQSASD